MSKVKIGILAFVLGIIAILVVFFIVGYFRPSRAGLVVDTNPRALVFMDGEELGRTKFEDTFKPGEVVVKLVPESDGTPLPPYETRVELVSGVKTIIQHDFGKTEDDSSGAIISFERVGRDETGISIVTIPDSAQVAIDGQIRGNAPYKTTGIAEGEHNLAVYLDGYQQKALDVKTYRGYQLIAVFQLAKQEINEEPEPTNSPTPTPEPSKEVKILDTDTGYLRVRNEPSTLAREVAQVEPGGVFKLIDTDDETGWYEIEYEEGKTGWISNTYARVVE